MARRPAIDDLYLAANWLDVHESAEDAEACKRVREWLLLLIDEAESRAARKALANKEKRS